MVGPADGGPHLGDRPCGTSLQRLVQFLIVFVIVTFVVMVFTRIGSRDPVRDLAGGAVGEAQIEQVREDYPYLDKPLRRAVRLLARRTSSRATSGRSYLQSQDGHRHVQAAPADDDLHRLLGDRASAC